MPGTSQLELTLLPGAAELLRAHARTLPQRDDLCGAFCGSLALHAAGLAPGDGDRLDQDAVALAAGTVITSHGGGHALPGGEAGRRDYRLALPAIDDPETSGTTASGVLDAVRDLGSGALATIPLAGPWSAEALAGVFDLAASCLQPVTLIANLLTGLLWGSRPSVATVVDHLLVGADSGPPPDWNVGHFVCIVARVSGPGGALYALADTYPALGWRGFHVQPQERLARAIERRERPAGGVIVVVATEEAAQVRAGATRLGLLEGVWDNGTVTR